MGRSLLGYLAAAYAETGVFDQAVKWQLESLKLTDAVNPIKTNRDARLELFRANKPYRKP